jgi:hypothetical protein
MAGHSLREMRSTDLPIKSLINSEEWVFGRLKSSVFSVIRQCNLTEGKGDESRAISTPKQQVCQERPRLPSSEMHDFRSLARRKQVEQSL